MKTEDPYRTSDDPFFHPYIPSLEADPSQWFDRTLLLYPDAPYQIRSLDASRRLFFRGDANDICIFIQDCYKELNRLRQISEPKIALCVVINSCHAEEFCRSETPWKLAAMALDNGVNEVVEATRVAVGCAKSLTETMPYAKFLTTLPETFLEPITDGELKPKHPFSGYPLAISMKSVAFNTKLDWKSRIVIDGAFVESDPSEAAQRLAHEALADKFREIFKVYPTDNPEFIIYDKPEHKPLFDRNFVDSVCTKPLDRFVLDVLY